MHQRCLNIDRRLLPVKFHYFFFMAALSCVMPFRTVFAKQLGISATAVGVIFCVLPFMKMFTNPLFGFLLDYFKRFRLILSVILMFVIFSHIAMVFIPSKSFTHPDKFNTIEKELNSKLTYLWTNDSLQSTCHPKLTLNIEYSSSRDVMGETNSFICDMQCSKHRNAILINNIENEFQCHVEIVSEFKVFVNVSDCDINVRLGKGQLAVFHAGVENLMLFEVNNALTRKVSSSILPSKHCSSEVKLTNSNPKYIKNREEVLSIRKQSKDTFESSENSIKKYYVQNEYIINFLDKKLCMDDLCTQEFYCQANKCFVDAKKNENNLGQSTVEQNEYISVQFWCFLILMIVSAVTSTSIMFMMDAVCYELLQERKDKYGRQRLWGTVGWGVGALIGGCLNQIATSDPGEIDYGPSFYMLGVLILVDLIPLYHLKVTDIKYSSHIFNDACFLLSKTVVLYNIFLVFLIGVLSGFLWNYEFWFLEEIGSSQVLLGLSQTFECLFELPCFFVSGWIIKKIGHNHCNSITFLCLGLRYLCFVFMYNPWWTLAAGLLHGPTFGLFYASMTTYGKSEAPPGTEATVQSLLHLSFEGIGVAAGTFLGGIGIDKFGSRASFTYAAEMSFFLLLVNILASVNFSKAKKDTKQIQISTLSDSILKL